jgi:hypothetical protein
MNTLPIELETEIWNMYWKGVFKENVLDRFKKTRDSIDKMDFFLDKHFYLNTSKDYDYKIAYYLREYNVLLNAIHGEFGIYYFIKCSYDKLPLCFDKNYLHSCFSKVSPKYQQICVYCLCNGIPNMSYRIVERFKKLSKRNII